jgi:hypothetical protein
MMAPPFSAEARARFQQVLATTASVTYTVNGVPTTEAVSDVVGYLSALAETGDPATFHYVSEIALTGGRLGVDDYLQLKDAVDHVLNYETATLHQSTAVALSATDPLILDGGIDGVLAILSPKAIIGDLRIGALSATASDLFDAPADSYSGVSDKANLLFGSAPFASGSTLIITSGELSLNHVAMLDGNGTLDLSAAGLAGTRAQFFSGATTLSASAQQALMALPGSVTISDGLSLAQRAVLAALDPGVTLNGPITDSVGNLGTYNADNQNWDINPAVFGGATINVTDSSVPVGLLIDLLKATVWSGHINTPNGDAIVGTVYEVQNLLAAYPANITLAPFSWLSLNDTVLDASYAMDFQAEHPGAQIDAAGVKGVEGNLDKLTALFGQQAYFHLSGHEKVSLRDVSVADLAGAKTLIATHTDGLVTASLLDLTGNLASQNPSTHVWSANAAIGAGYDVQVSDDNGTYTDMAIGAVLALVKAVGVNGHVSAANVDRFTGTAAEVQLLRDSAASIDSYDLTVTDASVNASTLIALRTSLGINHSVATTAGTITGTASALNTLFFHQDDYTVQSHTVDIVVTSQLRVVDLAGLRASYAAFTSGTVTGTLRDSVQNLTGHLSDSVGGYSVIDTVAVLSAHGAVVAGAKHLALADTIAHLAGGHTTAGGATSYTVVDTLDNLLDNDGSITGGAERIIAADTVAHLDGHTQDGGASGYTLIDSLTNITAASDSLLGAAMGVQLTDTMAGVETLAGWSETVHQAPLDARSLTIISGHIDKLVDVLQNTALTFSGSEVVEVINGGTAAQLNVLDAATTGVIAATVSGTAGELATLTGSGNQYQVTVTDSASVSQLAAIDAATTGNVTYTSVTDTASHLATLKNGVWSASGYVHDGTTVMVLGDVSEGELAALDAANGNGEVIVAAPAATDFVAMTSAMNDYIQILATKVFDVIDLAGVQVYDIDAPFAGGHGGILNLSGTDGQNTIAFHGYVPDGVNGAHLTMTQSGTTALFWDAQTHVEVAAISMSVDHAPIQNLVFEDGSSFHLTLVGTANPVVTLTQVFS